MKNREFISGYSGHIPGRLERSIKPRKNKPPRPDLPGYSGYVFALKPENVYGKTFHRATREIKCGDYYRNRPHFETNWRSMNKESFIDPSKVDGSHNILPNSKVFLKSVYLTQLKNSL